MKAPGHNKEALRRSEESYRDLFEQASDGIFISDSTGRYVDVNQAGCRMLGYTLVELCQLNLRDLLPPEEHLTKPIKLDEMQRGEIVISERSLICKNGALLPVEISAKMLSDGRLQGIVRDVTQRKRDELDLLKSEAFNKSLVNSSSDCIKTIDPEGRLLFMSVSGQRLLEIKEIKKYLGKSWIEFWYEKDQGRVKQALSVATRGGIGRFQAFSPTETGKPKWWDVIVSPIYNSDGSMDRLIATSRDITEQKISDAASVASELRYRRLFEAAQDGILILDAETGMIVDVNPFLTEILGYTHEEFLDKTIWDIGPLIDVLKNKAKFENLQDLEYVRYENLPLKAKDGREYAVEFVSNVYEVEGKKVIQCNIRDISERKLAEKLLARSEERFREFFEESLTGYFVANEYGRFQICNPSCLKILGLESIETAFRSSLKNFLMTSEDWTWLISALKAHGAVDSACLMRRFDARVIDVQASYVGEFDGEGELRSIKAYFKDVTEQKKAEIALRDSEEKFHSIFDHALDAIFVRSVEEGRITKFFEVNAAACLLLGYDREELLEMTPVDIEIGKTWEEILLRAEEIRAKGALDFETMFRTKSGNTVLVDLNVHRFTYQNRLMNVSIVREITERRKMEEQLRQSQKMEAIGRLAGGVAHDFNNMLSVIIGYADMAMMMLKVEDPLYKSMEAILNAADRSADLTKQLLAFSRKQTAIPQIIDLEETIAGSKKMLGRLIGEEINLKVITTGKIWKIRIDPTQINQILANLVVNARDAISGVGTVTIEMLNTVVDESMDRHALKAVPGDYVMMAIRDTGAGMNAETMEHIFEPFFTTKEEGKGTGLGLATVFGIVKQNQGIIHVYSEPSIGTTFKIYFPRFIGKVEETDEKVNPAIPTGDETILIVEDEKAVLNLMVSIVEASNYKVLSANDPEHALKLVGENDGEIHLLLTDVVMPSMNGKELSDKIKDLRPGIKTLFMSGYTSDIISERGLVDEGIHFIHKPISREALIRKVREVLDA